MSSESVASLSSPPAPWSEVRPEDWSDWRWQLRNLIRDPDQLGSLLPLSAAELAGMRSLQGIYHFAVTPYYFSLIRREDPDDPIRRMIIPSTDEVLHLDEGNDDPLGETADQVAPGLTHRYPDRVLLVVTSFCSSYCRFCIRKRNWRGSDAARTRTQVDEALAYIRSHPAVRDVLISGGDPLTLPIDQLDYVLGRLRRIPHVEFLRIGSREPVMLPMRIDEEILGLLDRHGPIWLNTHFNHPTEVTPEAGRACEQLMRAGVPLNNQAVLLRGVNDSLEVQRALVHALLRIRVRPYYLYQCDNVRGVRHLRTSVLKGIEIIEGLRGHTTGLAVPTFVVDAPDGGGKIPLHPSTIVSMSDRFLVLRNYEGILLRYPIENEEPAPAAPSLASRTLPGGVAGLLAGAESELRPADVPRLERRARGVSHPRRRKSIAIAPAGPKG